MNVIDLRNKSQDNHGSFETYIIAVGIGVQRINRFSMVRDECSAVVSLLSVWYNPAQALRAGEAREDDRAD